MRLSKARIPALADHEMSTEQKEILAAQYARGNPFNIFRTLVRAPIAIQRFLAWGSYILSSKNDLPAREREIVILRTGYNWKSGYEWAQHVRIGKDCGLTDEEVHAIKVGPSAPNWSPIERAMLEAVDELTSDSFIRDETWGKLSGLTEKQRMDLVFTTGQYTQVCMMLNSFGVQLDDDLEIDPDLMK